MNASHAIRISTVAVVVLSCYQYAASFNRIMLSDELTTLQSKFDFSSILPASKSLRLGPVFYNVYIPIDANQTTIANAKKIIQEQMMQRNWSSSEAGSDTSLLLYTLIGYPNITNDFCKPNCLPTRISNDW